MFYIKKNLYNNCFKISIIKRFLFNNTIIKYLFLTDNNNSFSLKQKNFKYLIHFLFLNIYFL